MPSLSIHSTTQARTDRLRVHRPYPSTLPTDPTDLIDPTDPIDPTDTTDTTDTTVAQMVSSLLSAAAGLLDSVADLDPSSRMAIEVIVLMALVYTLCGRRAHGPVSIPTNAYLVWQCIGEQNQADGDRPQKVQRTRERAQRTVRNIVLVQTQQHQI
mmetsp:Transcript_42416/g.113176  ORF Transcript_42416/g.113176 Transcript_42416/m.113176 type:complete len:156 (-) Transcript_42416:62-529(-)